MASSDAEVARLRNICAPPALLPAGLRGLPLTLMYIYLYVCVAGVLAHVDHGGAGGTFISVGLFYTHPRYKPQGKRR